MIKKLWCSPHKPLPEQGDGFVLLENQGADGAKLQTRINNCPNTRDELLDLAKDLVLFAEGLARLDPDCDGLDIYQPGGSPAFQFMLGQRMCVDGIYGYNGLIEDVYYAHSKRISQDTRMPDGTVKKVAIFKHEGWILV